MPALSNEQFKALRAAANALREIQEQTALNTYVEGGLVEAVHGLVERTDRIVPNVLPSFNRSSYEGLAVRMEGLRAYIIAARSALFEEIKDEGSVPAELLDFDYVSDAKLRTNLQRDYRELLRTLNEKCWKSTIILCGGIIEGLLTYRLLQDEAKAKAAPSAPKNPDITRWDFVFLIKVAVETGVVSRGADKLSHSVREYRNLAHPYNELREGLEANEQEAKIALEVLHLVDRDLKP